MSEKKTGKAGKIAPDRAPLPGQGLADRTKAVADDTTKKKTRKNIPRVAGHLLPDDDTGLYESPRVRSAKLRARMLQFHKIYNAAWRVRYAQHGSQDYRDRHIAHFVSVLERELQNCEDPEALLYAIADSLTAYPRGLPWEQ